VSTKVVGMEEGAIGDDRHERREMRAIGRMIF
jgi:hypothetical protein